MRNIAPAEYEEVLALVDAELRPAGARTRAVDDFPLALGADNQAGIFVQDVDGRIGACLACLVREVRSSGGVLTVALIGSVVTHPSFRGRGVSALLQRAVVRQLQDKGVPLAVLWSDRPELYAGRGFQGAGIEHHVDLAGWRPPENPAAPVGVRPFQPADTAMVDACYAQHPYGVVRQAGDSAALYTMPGTRGFLCGDAHGDVAYAFCGKGADFPAYVLEWGGASERVLSLLAWMREKVGARFVLVPQGEEGLRDLLASQGAACLARPAGLWAVLSPEGLSHRVAGQGSLASTVAMGTTADPAFWLGRVRTDGSVREGVLRVAIWGFDSV